MEKVSDGIEESSALKFAFGIALAKRMGWSRDAAERIAQHVVLDHENGHTYLELRWRDQGVVAGIVPDGEVDWDRVDALAEAVEADLKMRLGRFGEEFPWS